jgi:two-component system, OmpR family, response regulator
MTVANQVAFGNAVAWRLAGRLASRKVVLIVTDDDELAQEVRIELEACGFIVHVARSRSEGLQAFHSLGASAIIVDRMRDGLDGLMIVEALRASGISNPVLAVGAPKSVEERIAYIRSGADDYLTRPFDLRELTVRVEALLRRCRDDRPTVLEVGAIEMDLVSRTVRCMGRRIDLLPREFVLLEYFGRHPRETLSRRQLLEDVWRSKAKTKTNVVDVQVGNLRRKLDPTGERRFIVNVRGTGFRFEPDGLD